MSATERGRFDVAPWTVENSALAMLVIGTAGAVFSGPDVGDPGLGGTVATVVAGVLVLAAACLAVGLLGRVVDLPFTRTRALNAAVFLGFGAVTANGLLAARSAWLTEGPARVLAFIALIAVVVVGFLGGAMGLGWRLDS
jgi:hypothetical protein